MRTVSPFLGKLVPSLKRVQDGSSRQQRSGYAPRTPASRMHVRHEPRSLRFYRDPHVVVRVRRAFATAEHTGTRSTKVPASATRPFPTSSTQHTLQLKVCQLHRVCATLVRAVLLLRTQFCDYFCNICTTRWSLHPRSSLGQVGLPSWTPKSRRSATVVAGCSKLLKKA